MPLTPKEVALALGAVAIAGATLGTGAAVLAVVGAGAGHILFPPDDPTAGAVTTEAKAAATPLTTDLGREPRSRGLAG
jgi:hypothetical protein